MVDVIIKKYKPSNHKVKALIYGPAGAGKTVFGSTAPNPIFASAESGLLSIADKEPAYYDIKCLLDLKNLLKFLQSGKHEYETVIIDSITEINEIIKAEIERRTGHSVQKNEWDEVGKTIRSILRSFRNLNMHVLFIALEKNITDEEKIHQIVPDLNGKAATTIAQFVDIVGYLSVDGQGVRHVRTAESSSNRYLTKDRTGKIGNDEDPDFSIWVKKASTIVIGEQQIMNEFTIPPKAEPPKSESKPPVPPIKPPLKAEPITVENISWFENCWRKFYPTTEKFKKLGEKGRNRALIDFLKRYGNYFTIKSLPDDLGIKIAKMMEEELKKKASPPVQPLDEQIAGLIQQIQMEEADYNNSCENPTDTEQFRAAQVKHVEKIQGLKEKLAELGQLAKDLVPPEEHIPDKTDEEKMDEALAPAMEQMKEQEKNPEGLKTTSEDVKEGEVVNS